MSQIINPDGQVLVSAFHAWMSCSGLRAARARNKRFVYGNQWADPCVDRNGNAMTEGERVAQNGATPLTNNLLRQLLRSVLGRFRTDVLAKADGENDLEAPKQQCQLDELDSRMLEEFLISGCALQRVEGASGGINVSNVAIDRWFADRITDPRATDCQLIGALHDLTLPELITRVADGKRSKALWISRLYATRPDERTGAWTTAIGADTARSLDFWRADARRLRAIEVWTAESEPVMLCHNRRTATLETIPIANTRRIREAKTNPDIQMRWSLDKYWLCRWFSPMGDLLAVSRATSHPFVVKLYPLIDGEVHSFVEGTIDQQKHVNRMVTLLDQVMTANAKGVLLFPETALPDGVTWAEIRRAWSNPGGIIPYDPRLSDARPEQIVSNGTDIGAYEMIKLQMQLLEQVSGVSGALQGHATTSNSASLYEMQSQNAEIALADIFETFKNFRLQRNLRIKKLLS